MFSPVRQLTDRRSSTYSLPRGLMEPSRTAELPPYKIPHSLANEFRLIGPRLIDTLPPISGIRLEAFEGPARNRVEGGITPAVLPHHRRCRSATGGLTLPSFQQRDQPQPAGPSRCVLSLEAGETAPETNQAS
jgi:hypothetical protein